MGKTIRKNCKKLVFSVSESLNDKAANLWMYPYNMYAHMSVGMSYSEIGMKWVWYMYLQINNNSGLSLNTLLIVG